MAVKELIQGTSNKAKADFLREVNLLNLKHFCWSASVFCRAGAELDLKAASNTRMLSADYAQ